MPVLFTCARGHQWHRDSPADDAAELCPVCGMPSASSVAVAQMPDPLGSTVAARGLAPPSAVPPFRGHLPQLPGLELSEVLGQGGMGIVYKAWQHSHTRW